MKITLKSEEQVLALVKRMVYLAYKAVGYASGMGVFQAVDAADEEKVWLRAYNQGDYPMRNTSDNKVYCDYVFGRMMKWGCGWKGCEITIRDQEFRPDYQEFCRKYKDNAALVDAALASLGIIDVKIS